MRRFLLPGFVLAAIAAIAITFSDPTAARTPIMPKPQVTDLTPGSGEPARPGDTLDVHYTGWLTDGTKFDSSLDRGEPISVTLGMHQVIPGWEMGLEGMKVGGRRELLIPPQLAYGAKGAGGVIPPNATLKFEVELVSLKPRKYDDLSNGQLKDMLAQGAKIVDIRRPEEWKKTGVVEGSKLLTFFIDKKGTVNPKFVGEFTAFAKPGEPVILICRTGNRTRVVSHLISERLGYGKIYNVTDGITRWIKEGHPVSRPTG